MERLTEKSNGKYLADIVDEEEDDGGLGHAIPIDSQKVDVLIQKLGEYEDLEEQGKLLKLPCNVGDTVYQIIGGLVEPCTVKRIFLAGDKDENGNQLYMMGLHYDRENCIFTSAKVHSSYIGKTIFLTREGAENELRRREDIHAEEKEQPETE